GFKALCFNAKLIGSRLQGRHLINAFVVACGISGSATFDTGDGDFRIGDHCALRVGNSSFKGCSTDIGLCKGRQALRREKYQQGEKMENFFHAITSDSGKLSSWS